uniref:Putative translation initiation factor if-2 panstrongylus lignarius n=1 Tax=Rhodnius prolixus TaxID=13249 RepID=A0A4P6D8U6_RHOPR
MSGLDSLEKLLLLEILVDNVYYEKTTVDPDLLAKLQDTNVRFKFGDFPSIDIGEVDFCQTEEGYDNSEVTFKSGKSVLFALPDVRGPGRQAFDINVTVSRRMVTKKPGPGENTEVATEWKLHDLGKTVIHLGDSFINLLEATAYEGICPASRTVRDSYPFANEDEVVVGYVTVFVRLSCFGKIIVTQFQADSLEDKSYCFRGGEDEGAPAMPEVQIHEQRQLYGGGEPQMMPMMPPYMPPMPSSCPQTVKVPLKKRPVIPKCGRVPSDIVSSGSEGEKKSYCLHRNCPQGYPRPPWFNGKRGPSAAAESRYYSGPLVGSAAFKGDDIVFQTSHPLYPSKPANVNHDAVFKLNQEPDQPRQNVQLASQKFLPEIDDENDIFLLKFDKQDNNNKPAKLIVTLKTPKAPQLSAHKCTSDRPCQTEGVLTKKKPPAFTTSEIADVFGKKGSEKSLKGKKKEK